MTKTKIIETTEKYDKDGKLVEKITREETTEDDTNCLPFVDVPERNPPVMLYGNENGYCPDGAVNITAESVIMNPPVD